MKEYKLFFFYNLVEMVAESDPP